MMRGLYKTPSAVYPAQELGFSDMKSLIFPECAK